MFFHHKISLSNLMILVLIFFVNTVKCLNNCILLKTLLCYCDNDELATVYCNYDNKLLNSDIIEQIILDNYKVKNLVYSNYLNLPKGEDIQQFKNLSILSIYYTVVNKIPSASFLNLNNLNELRVTGTNITTIEATAISNLPSLIKLDLSHNKISKINRNAFNFLPKLEILDLMNNHIQELHGGTFASLKMLKNLDLENNPLKKFQPALFQSNKNFLAENSFLKFSSDNLNCGCDYNWLIDIYKNTKSDYNKEFIKDTKCWQDFNQKGLINFDAKERCLKLMNNSVANNTNEKKVQTPIFPTEAVFPTTLNVSINNLFNETFKKNPIESLLNYFPIILNNTIGNKITGNNLTINYFINFYLPKSDDKR